MSAVESSLDEPQEIEWHNQDALAFRGHDLILDQMRSWVEHFGWEWPPDSVQEYLIKKTPDSTGEYAMRWHPRQTARGASPYTILWAGPVSMLLDGKSTSVVMEPTP